jgi:hypothetical protein
MSSIVLGLDAESVSSLTQWVIGNRIAGLISSINPGATFHLSVTEPSLESPKARSFSLIDYEVALTKIVGKISKFRLPVADAVLKTSDEENEDGLVELMILFQSSPIYAEVAEQAASSLHGAEVFPDPCISVGLIKGRSSIEIIPALRRSLRSLPVNLYIETIQYCNTVYPDRSYALRLRDHEDSTAGNSSNLFCMDSPNTNTMNRSTTVATASSMNEHQYALFRSGVILVDITRERILLGCTVERDATEGVSYEAFSELSAEPCPTGLETAVDTAKRAALTLSLRYIEQPIVKGDFSKHVTIYSDSGEPELTVFFVYTTIDFSHVVDGFNDLAAKRIQRGMKFEVTELKFFPLRKIIKSVLDGTNIKVFSKEIRKTVTKFIGVCEQNTPYALCPRTVRVLKEASSILSSISYTVTESISEPTLLPLARQLSDESKEVADYALSKGKSNSAMGSKEAIDERQKHLFEALRCIATAHIEGRISKSEKDSLKRSIAMRVLYDSETMMKMAFDEQRALLVEMSSRSL